MPRLSDLVILDCSRYWRDPPQALTLCFHHYPNIRSLQLHLTLFYSPVAPCASLRHLELARCVIRASCTLAAGYVPSLRSVHDALELFPNLETLSLTYSLSDGDWYVDLPELTKTVHLPRLRRLEIEDVPFYIPRFLSHLAFPSTTALMLEPAYRLAFESPLTLPVFPGINPCQCPAPDAEISLYLDFSNSRSRHSEGFARWETHGEGARPVRVTLAGAAGSLDTIAHFTRELVHALAPAPACGMTALTAKGSWALSSDRHAHPQHSAQEYWTAFLPDLAGLRRLACATDGATRDFIDVLGRPLPRSGEFPCPGLADLALVWNLPYTYGASLEFGRERQSGGEDRDEETTQDGAGYLGPEHTASLGALCDTLRACLTERVRVGRCGPIRKLSVALRGSYGRSIAVQRWQAALVEQQLRGGLGHLVGEVAVVDEVD